MLFRHIIVLTLTMNLLSSCVSIAAPSKSTDPPARRPQQERENAAEQEAKPPAQHTDSEAEAVKETSSDSASPPESDDVSTESNPPEIPLIEVPHVSLEDRLPENLTAGRKSQISDQVQFLLLSPQLGVHSAEGEALKGEAEAPAVPTESVSPKTPEA